jgi:hypothetical protein
MTKIAKIAQAAQKKLLTECAFSKSARRENRRAGTQTIPTDKIMAAARLVFEHDFTRSRIARQMNLSVSYLAKLLSDARIDGTYAVRVFPGTKAAPKAKKAATKTKAKAKKAA